MAFGKFRDPTLSGDLLVFQAVRWYLSKHFALIGKCYNTKLLAKPETHALTGGQMNANRMDAHLISAGVVRWLDRLPVLPTCVAEQFF